MEVSVSNSQNHQTLKRPGTVRAIFMLTSFKILLSIVFYIVFATGIASIEGVSANMILYTLLGYVALAIPIFYFIHKPNVWAVRVGLFIDILISLPLTAVIGIVLSAICIGLTFSKSAKSYFQ